MGASRARSLDRMAFAKLTQTTAAGTVVVLQPHHEMHGWRRWSKVIPHTKPQKERVHHNDAIAKGAQAMASMLGYTFDDGGEHAPTELPPVDIKNR